jgi:hypothetical protein
MSVTLATIITDLNGSVKPTAEEITAWGALKLHENASKTVTTKVGLFGADLTAFNEACTKAGDAICKPADYVDYNGWGIGVNWADSEATTTAGSFNSLVFATSLKFLAI